MTTASGELRVCANGDIFRIANGTYVKPFPDDLGYLTVEISGEEYYVHDMVCMSFHGAMPSDKPYVNHINGKLTDNRAANLEWTDRHIPTRREVVVSPSPQFQHDIKN